MLMTLQLSISSEWQSSAVTDGHNPASFTKVAEERSDSNEPNLAFERSLCQGVKGFFSARAELAKLAFLQTQEE